MTDHPIIFSAPMVRALIEGRKTMTRRLAWRGPVTQFYPSSWQKVKPGDRLWARENFNVLAPTISADGPHSCIYLADNTGPQHLMKWKPSIHMPRWASRLTLEVTAVKVERLQAISCADAIVEGITPAGNSLTIDCDTPDPREGFKSLWESLHGTGSWDADPEVVALTFVVHKTNIDKLGEPK